MAEDYQLGRNDFEELIKHLGRHKQPQELGRLLAEQDIIEIKRKWPEIVTQALATHSLPFKIQKGELYIQTDHNIFGQQLQLIQNKILEKVKAINPAISRIRVKVGKIYWGKKPAADTKMSDIMSQPDTVVSKSSEKSETLNNLIDELENI